MIPPGTRSASRARCSPTRRLSASFSITHGPAMRKSAFAGNAGDALIGRLHERWRRAAALTPALRLRARGNERREERVRTRGARAELGMELAADEPRVLRQLDDLHERPIGGQAAQPESVLDERLTVDIRHLVAVQIGRASCRERV